MSRRILVDIKNRVRPLRNTSFKVNLKHIKVVRIPLRRFLSGFLVLFFIVSFGFNWVLAPTRGDVFAAPPSAEEKRILEEQLAQLERQMEEYEAKISDYKKEGKSLQSEISTLNAKISKLNAQIKAVILNLQKLDKELSQTQNDMTVTESKMDVKKRIVSEILKEIYQRNDQGALMIFLANIKMSDFFNEMNHLSSVQDRLRINVEELADLHSQLSDQKEQLSLEKNDVESLKQYQELQKGLVQKTKSDKDNLLKITKGKESEYKKILTETQKTAAQIRSRIFELIGGGELTFEEAYKFAKFAESKTGVRAALVLAVLDKESALGKNVGRCDYKTAMHPTRDIPVFLEILNELGMSPDTVKVSCPIRSDGAYGGAMGPAQFIPSTWVMYKDRIAALTGNNPPSPWRHIDAFMATALYLKSAGADGGSIAAERQAAAKYYAGSRWRNYLWTYGDRVVTRAQQFQADINTLNA